MKFVLWSSLCNIYKNTHTIRIYLNFITFFLILRMLIASCCSDHLGKNTYFLLSLKGQERYGNMTRVYYKEAVGALVVFDMTRLSTFQAVLKWKGDLDSKVNL